MDSDYNVRPNRASNPGPNSLEASVLHKSEANNNLKATYKIGWPI